MADVIATDNAIWILDNSNTGKLNRFDPESKSIVASIPVGVASQPGREELAVNDFGVWVAYAADGTLTRIDPHTDVITATFHLAPSHLGPITVSPEAVWAVNTEGNTLTRIDPTTGNVTATVAVANAPTSVAYGAGSVWACSNHGGTTGLTRIDPATNHIVAQIDVGNSQGYACDWVQFQTDALWLVAFDAHTQRKDVLERIDLATNQVVATVHLRGDIQAPLAIGAQDLWACSSEGSLSLTGGEYRIATQTNQVLGTLSLGCTGAVISSGAIWLVDAAAGELVPVTPAR
jgi:streptogramin lyase